MMFNEFLSCFLLLLTAVSSLPSYRDRIPNGNNVPHPCLPGTTWTGVGHLQSAGAGDRNLFGEVS